ncbi:hypothetical protein AYI69_g8642 [Smittium culicis]|uniref:Uncharacterized protein n=1 Tax=Smittium culicis TaxID=133412 RepID=A0A1R1XI93_9FUNG|nr:hypothetical protein AYI69_g8642 [Smittium culicis]
MSATTSPSDDHFPLVLTPPIFGDDYEEDMVYSPIKLSRRHDTAQLAEINPQDPTLPSTLEITQKLKKITPDVELPLFLDHDTGLVNLFYKGCKEVCSYCKCVGHWKSDNEILNKIIYEKKARKGANKMGFVFKSTEPEKTVGLESTAPNIKNLLFETAGVTKTNDGDKEAAETKKIEPNEDSGSSHTTPVRTIRGTTGIKKPPASSIAQIQLEPSTLKKISSYDDTGSDYNTINYSKQKNINANKKAIETDDYEESSDYERSSSPMEIKKEHIIFKNIQSDSDGNNTPSEHSMMVGKARLGLVPQKEFLNYVSGVDRAPQGANAANMELNSIPPGDTGADTEMRQNTN